MALFPLQPGLYPLGQLDTVDTEIASILGGEVLTLTTVGTANSSTETSAFDTKDGYIFDVTATIQNRPATTRASTAAQFPLFLADDGTTGYGTLFGSLIGNPLGLNPAGTALGPSTAAGSGKVTCWDKPGQYAVSIDSVASDFITSIAVGAFGGLAPGTVLGFGNSTAIGKLAHNSCSLKVVGTGVAYFIEFDSAPTNNSFGSLVTTPARLLGGTETYNRVVFNYHAGAGNRTL